MVSSLLPVYNRHPITMVNGEGAYLHDDTGKRYLDFMAGIAVNSLGHCHPHLVAAIKRQVDILWHCSNYFYTPWQNTLANRLVEHTFAEKVFFCNSGLEAVETGVKMIRKYHFERGQKTRNRIITMQGGFHGRSMTGVSAGMNERGITGFAPLLKGFDQVAFNDLLAVKNAITPDTGGILLEPIQGEGGVRVASHDYLRGLRALCDEHNMLLFFDEVQCGIGRSGSFLAFEQAGIAPDVCAIAKGIGSGFPVAACLATDKAASGMTPGSHGGTMGGNALAMAAAHAVLDVVWDEDFIVQVSEVSAQLKQALDDLAKDFPNLIEEVRGTGLMLGLKTKVKHTDLAHKLMMNGLLTAPCAGDSVIRIVPPLIITRLHVDEAITLFRKTFEAWT